MMKYVRAVKNLLAINIILLVTLTEKTSQSDFLQPRQQNAKISTYPIEGNNNTFLQSDHSSI